MAEQDQLCAVFAKVSFNSPETVRRCGGSGRKKKRDRMTRDGGYRYYRYPAEVQWRSGQFVDFGWNKDKAKLAPNPFTTDNISHLSWRWTRWSKVLWCDKFYWRKICPLQQLLRWISSLQEEDNSSWWLWKFHYFLLV